MTRGLDVKNRAGSLRIAIESRLWKNTRERENVARMLLALGTYDPVMQIYPEMFENLPDEGIFVRRFADHFL